MARSDRIGASGRGLDSPVPRERRSDVDGSRLAADADLDGAVAAVLGRRDAPTDGVDDYCVRLQAALGKRQRTLRLVRLDWPEFGWLNALRQLRRYTQRRPWDCAFVQYTPLMWPARGFPFGVLSVLSVLRRGRVPVILVAHDPSPFPGNRIRDRARRRTQLAVLRCAARGANSVISTIPPQQVPWMRDPAMITKVTFVPVGSNVPERWAESDVAKAGEPTVVVFGVTHGRSGCAEASLVADVVRRASVETGPVHLIVLGRGSREVAGALHQSLDGGTVKVSVVGLLPPGHVSDLLARAHVQLFVRGGVSTRRGSAIAGIACGLPVVGYASEETVFPITEAGVRLVPEGDQQGLARELAAVLSDSTLREALSVRSRDTMRHYFSWDAIARRYQELLGAQR